MASVTMRSLASDSEEEEMLLDSADWEDNSSSGDQLDGSSDNEEGPGSFSEQRAAAMAGYKVLTLAQVQDLQAAALQQVQELLHCSQTVARSILIHFRWDPERVMGVYVDKGLDTLYSLVGIPQVSSRNAPAEVAGGRGQGSPHDQLQCQICCEDVTASQCPTMTCGHVYCSTCWAQHFKTGIQEGRSRNLRCMAYRCGAPCDEMVVARLLEGTPEGKRFGEALQTSYIEDNSLACFCPSVPWCGRAVVVTGEVVCEPECTCGHSFCFKCKRAPHSPCTCQMWDAWEEKTQGDSETRNWIQANTKPCPRCTKPVEKNGGCNHVVCKCGQSFCWLCGASTGMAHTYQSIEGHTCGRWKEEADRKASAAARSHQRYMHYFERYKGHLDSYKKECEKRSTLLDRLATQLSQGCDGRSYDWLVAAMDQLKVARRVLAPSYVFAYFTFGGEMFKDDFTPAQNAVNQNLFEDQQQMLENEVERLSKLTQLCSANLVPSSAPGVVPVGTPRAAGTPVVVPPGSTGTSATVGIDDSERVKVINSTVNIQRRILKFYDMVQEILDQLQTCTAHIASFVPRK